MTERPATLVDLVWIGDLKFSTTFRARHASQAGTGPPMIVDSSGAAGPSPVQALCAALAGCMSVDVVHILKKGRHTFESVRSRLTAERAPTDPRRLTAVGIHFTIVGSVPDDAVERAIGLSRDKYCSVWHSLRQDIALKVTFDVTDVLGSAGP